MESRILLILVSIALSVSLKSQTPFSGRLNGEDGLPLGFATVKLMKGHTTVKAVNADSLGYFSLVPPDGKNYDLVISWNGNTVSFPNARPEDIENLALDGYIKLQTRIIKEKITPDSK